MSQIPIGPDPAATVADTAANGHGDWVIVQRTSNPADADLFYAGRDDYGIGGFGAYNPQVTLRFPRSDLAAASAIRARQDSTGSERIVVRNYRTGQEFAGPSMPLPAH